MVPESSYKIAQRDMNVIFFSAHFPDCSAHFCRNLKDLGACVLGIGDAPYETLGDYLKGGLNDYYRVCSMENYDEVLRAVGYFTHRFGKIDRFESLTEHWLETEARIRTDFNIYGTRTDFIANLRQKSKMKEFFRKSGVKTVDFVPCEDQAAAARFAAKAGYPLIAKPDKGSGASQTHKIGNALELENFFKNKTPDVPFILEEFIDGDIVTYDGLVDRHGTIQFATSHYFEQGIMDVVNNDDHVFYFSNKGAPTEVDEAGRKIVKAFDVRERFFHIELFKSRKNGEIVSLEVNMRPGGGWIPDAINFAYDMDIYREWANMLVNNRFSGPHAAKYCVGYAGRKDHKRYTHTHAAIIRKFGVKIVKHAVIEPIFSRVVGNYGYQFRSPSLPEVKEMIAFIQETH
jgi:hypothetical protein